MRLVINARSDGRVGDDVELCLLALDGDAGGLGGMLIEVYEGSHGNTEQVVDTKYEIMSSVTGDLRKISRARLSDMLMGEKSRSLGIDCVEK